VAINQSTPSLSLPLVFIGDRLMAARSHKRRLVLAHVPLSLCTPPLDNWKKVVGGLYGRGGGCVCTSVRLELCYISRPLGSIYIYMSREAEKEEGRDQSAVKVPPERRRADLSSTFFFSPFTFPFFCVWCLPFDRCGELLDLSSALYSKVEDNIPKKIGK
jgi:hypothetical protein